MNAFEIGAKEFPLLADGDVYSTYKKRLEQIQFYLRTSRRHKVLTLAGCAGSIALLAGILLFHGMPFPVKALLFGVSAVLCLISLRLYVAEGVGALKMARVSGFYECGLERLRGEWRGKNTGGDDFARQKHLYQHDLNILGRGSIFELLCTTRSELGAEWLAAYLLDPVDIEEACKRQAAVKELCSLNELREQIAQLGKYAFQECRLSSFEEWLDSPAISPGRISRILLFVVGVTLAMFALLIFAGVIGWVSIWPLFAPLFLVQAIVGTIWRRRMRDQLRVLEMLGSELSVLRQGLELMQRQTFASAKLCVMTDRLRSKNSAKIVRRLEKIVQGLGQTRKEAFFLPGFFLAADVQLLAAAAEWKRQYQKEFMAWIQAWAEFDALNAIACYAYEHPNNVFPVLVREGAIFEAEELGHPLLPVEKCIGNRVALGAEARFYLLSGSNMSGKST